jgi:hypothetical protein
MYRHLSSGLSRSRNYSTERNKAIIDLLTKCELTPWCSNIDVQYPALSGLKEEDVSPTRNAYKIRSFEIAIAAIRGHDKPIHSGQEAIKVCPLLD